MLKMVENASGQRVVALLGVGVDLDSKEVDLVEKEGLALRLIRNPDQAEEALGDLSSDLEWIAYSLMADVGALPPMTWKLPQCAP